MKRKYKDSLQVLCMYLAASICIFILFLILFFIIKNGISHINLDFLFNTYSPTKEDAGIFPMIIGTLYIVFITLCIATPIGLGSAIYLNEYAKVNRFSNLIRFAINGLASVPSIVYGLFGFALFVSILKDFTNGYSILSGSLTLAIMILPVLIKTIEEALKMLPNSLREASLALGASKTQTLFKVIIPACFPNIMNAIILSMGRIVSESAPLLLTAGMVYLIPTSIYSSSRTLTTHLYYLASEAVDTNATQQAYATAVVLIIMIVILNLITRFIESKVTKKVGK